MTLRSCFPLPSTKWSLSEPALSGGELGRVGQFAGTLPGRLMDVDSEILVTSSRALGFLRACSTLLGTADVGMGAIANIQPHVVKLFSCRTTVAVALRQIGKSLRAITRILLS